MVRRTPRQADLKMTIASSPRRHGCTTMRLSPVWRLDYHGYVVVMNLTRG